MVWCPEEGAEGPDDGRTFRNMEDHEEAALAWAQREDWSSAEYRIVSGKATPTVCVQSETGEVQRFQVSGEAVPHYSAKQLRQDEGDHDA